MKEERSKIIIADQSQQNKDHAVEGLLQTHTEDKVRRRKAAQREWTRAHLIRKQEKKRKLEEQASQRARYRARIQKQEEKRKLEEDLEADRLRKENQRKRQQASRARKKQADVIRKKTKVRFADNTMLPSFLTPARKRAPTVAKAPPQTPQEQYLEAETDRRNERKEILDSMKKYADMTDKHADMTNEHGDMVKTMMKIQAESEKRAYEVAMTPLKPHPQDLEPGLQSSKKTRDVQRHLDYVYAEEVQDESLDDFMSPMKTTPDGKGVEEVETVEEEEGSEEEDPLDRVLALSADELPKVLTVDFIKSVAPEKIDVLYAKCKNSRLIFDRSKLTKKQFCAILKVAGVKTRSTMAKCDLVDALKERFP